MQQKQYQISHLDSEILAICPVQEHDEILILTQDGGLYRFDLVHQKLKEILKITLPIRLNREDGYFPQPRYALHASANRKYSAIVVDYGQFGQVICNQTGEILLHLNTQNYHEDTVPFSLAFTTFEGDDIIIYRSNWNKLDSYNLTQKNSSTERTIAEYKNERPEHYLDYFHGALYISPNGKYILDDGWVWHPISIPTIWSTANWLSSNPYESEDGSSLKTLCYRDNWNSVLCWLDQEHIAIWNIELWDEEEFELKPKPFNRLGIHILSINDTKSDEEDVPRYWQMPEQTQEILNMYADDGKLIVIGNENISLYDLASQKLIEQIANTLANKQHLKRHSLWAFQAHTLIETYLV